MANLRDTVINGTLTITGEYDIFLGEVDDKVVPRDTAFNEVSKIITPDVQDNDRVGYGDIVVTDDRIYFGVPYESTKGTAAGCIYIYDLNGVYKSKVYASDAQAGDHFGSSVAVANGRIVVGAPLEDTGGSNAGTVYIFDINGNQIAKIQASDKAANFKFGDSVSISDNYIIVGSPGENSNEGAVYIYDLSGSEIRKIKASDASSLRYFGGRVVASNGKIAVNSTYSETLSSGEETSTGTVYIFDLSGNQLKRLQATDQFYNNNFGIDIDMLRNKLVIGLTNGSNGAAYIYDTDGNELKKISPTNIPSNLSFGGSVAICDDTILVGAIGTNVSGITSIYDDDGNFKFKITPKNPVDDDLFGAKLSVKNNRIVAGSSSNDTGGSDGGAVYIFNNISNPPISIVDKILYNKDFGYVPVNKVFTKDIHSGDNFGYSVAISNTIAVIGSIYDSSETTLGGAAYIFDINGSYKTKIYASDKASHDKFGSSVAASNERIVVGAPEKYSGDSSVGAAYIFDIYGNQIAKIEASDKQAGDSFGYSVAASNNRIVVGAPLEDTGGSNAGTVYIFDINGNQIAKIQASDAALSDNFGYSVAATDSKILVGAPGKDSAKGAAYIFDINGTQLAKIQASDPTNNDKFGYSVGISEAGIVVGSPYEDTNGTDSGAAYVFDINGTQLFKTKSPNANNGYEFGSSVSIAGSKIAIGSPKESTKTTNDGAVYIFDLSNKLLSKILATDIVTDSFLGNSVSISDDRILIGAYKDETIAYNGGISYLFYNDK